MKNLIISVALILIWTPNTSVAGELAEALIGACKLQGTNRHAIFVPTSQDRTCAQACAALSCSDTATCVRGWTLWHDKFYGYGSECQNNSAGAQFKPTGMFCCCSGQACTVPASLSEYKY